MISPSSLPLHLFQISFLSLLQSTTIFFLFFFYLMSLTLSSNFPSLISTLISIKKSICIVEFLLFFFFMWFLGCWALVATWNHTRLFSGHPQSAYCWHTEHFSAASDPGTGQHIISCGSVTVLLKRNNEEEHEMTARRNLKFLESSSENSVRHIVCVWKYTV